MGLNCISFPDAKALRCSIVSLGAFLRSPQLFRLAETGFFRLSCFGCVTKGLAFLRLFLDRFCMHFLFILGIEKRQEFIRPNQMLIGSIRATIRANVLSQSQFKM